jgi:hypothetical protein
MSVIEDIEASQPACSVLGLALFHHFLLPMNWAGELPAMQVTVTVSDAIIREAGARGLPVVDFIESLIDKGLSVAPERPVLDNAIERIRALRSPGPIPRQ